MTENDSHSTRETDESANEATGDPEAYAADTPLTWVFGDHPEPKLIATFLSERDRDLNVTTISDIAGISRGAVYNHLDDLLDYEIIKETREMGGQLYQINKENDYVKILLKIENQLLDEWYGSVDSDEPLDAEDSGIERTVENQELASEVGHGYAEETPLTWILGDHPEVKIVATLLSEHTNDLNVTDIARIAGVSRNDVYDHLETLQKYELVEQTREIGRSKLYIIDDSKRSVQLINKLEDQLITDWYNQKEIISPPDGDC